MAEEKKDAKPKKPLNKTLIMHSVFALVNLGVMGYFTMLAYKATIGYKPPSITELQLEKQKQMEEEAKKLSALGPLVYTMDKFTVNLAGEPRRTIRLEVNLEMLGKEGFEEIIDPDNRAKARDRIVRILNDKSFAELETIQGKLYLKDRIAGEVNGILDKGIVKDVFFTDFVVQ